MVSGLSTAPNLPLSPPGKAAPGGTGTEARSTSGTALPCACPLSPPLELYLIEEKKWRRGTSKHQTDRSCK